MIYIQVTLQSLIVIPCHLLPSPPLLFVQRAPLLAENMDHPPSNSDSPVNAAYPPAIHPCRLPLILRSASHLYPLLSLKVQPIPNAHRFANLLERLLESREAAIPWRRHWIGRRIHMHNSWLVIHHSSRYASLTLHPGSCTRCFWTTSYATFIWSEDIWFERDLHSGIRSITILFEIPLTTPSIQIRALFPALEDYEGDWPTYDCLLTHLKNRRRARYTTPDESEPERSEPPENDEKKGGKKVGFAVAEQVKRRKRKGGAKE